MNQLVNTHASQSGLWLWIPGSLALQAPRNDEWDDIMHELIGDIPLCILFAWGLRLAGQFLRQPSILAYLIAGFAIGPFGAAPLERIGVIDFNLVMFPTLSERGIHVTDGDISHVDTLVHAGEVLP